MCDVILTDQFGNQLSFRYGEVAQKFLETHKYSKHGTGQELKCNNCKEQFIEKHVLDMHHRSYHLGQNVKPF